MVAPYALSDERLSEVYLVGCLLVLQEVSFDVEYTVDVDASTLSPDPTEGVRDISFITLSCYKSACVLDRGKMRSQAGNGVMIWDGKSRIDLSGQSTAYTNLVKFGYCAEYDKAKLDYKAGKSLVGRAIVGPFSSPRVCLDDLTNRRMF